MPWYPGPLLGYMSQAHECFSNPPPHHPLPPHTARVHGHSSPPHHMCMGAPLHPALWVFSPSTTGWCISTCLLHFVASCLTFDCPALSSLPTRGCQCPLHRRSCCAALPVPTSLSCVRQQKQEGGGPVRPEGSSGQVGAWGLHVNSSQAVYGLWATSWTAPIYKLASYKKS